RVTCAARFLGIIATAQKSSTHHTAHTMNLEKLVPLRPFLLITAIFGFLVVNGPFLYFALVARDVFSQAMSNGMALVFIGEAFLLVAFFAFLIAKMGWKRPGWIFFVAMSLLGSLAFSLPLQLYLMSRPQAAESGDAKA
ncbi:MAG: hypothetical protein ACFCU3_03615, partial [Verrucomicrobiales bacterium]